MFRSCICHRRLCTKVSLNYFFAAEKFSYRCAHSVLLASPFLSSPETQSCTMVCHHNYLHHNHNAVTYITYVILLSPLRHRGSTNHHQRTLFEPFAFTSYRVFLASPSTVLFRVILGLPLALFLRIPHQRTCLSIVAYLLRSACPIHHRFLAFICKSTQASQLNCSAALHWR